MSKHGTAYDLGQYNEVLKAVITELPAALDGTDPKAMITGIQNRGEVLRLALNRALVEVANTEEPAILRLISSAGETLVIDPTTGVETILASAGVFADIDPNFRAWGVDEPSGPTPATPVMPYELTRDASSRQVFSPNPDKLCLTQSQILGFGRKHRRQVAELLRRYSLMLFLFRSKGKRFVAIVSLDSGGLRAGLGEYDRGGLWRVDGCSRQPCVIIPATVTP